MNAEDFKKETHEVLLDFLIQTEDETDNITTGVKCIMAQFLLNTRRALNIAGRANGGYIKPSELIDIQIEELRRCIIDLSQRENFKNDKETLQ